MRIAALSLAALALAAAGPARAEGFNNLFAGLNGIVTAPADPFMMAVDPPGDLELPDDPDWITRAGHAVFMFPVGVVYGGYRLFMGAVDVALSPFWVFPTLSPEAHWDLVPGWEIEWE